MTENKDVRAFHFSISAFFKGVGDSLYAFFVSAGETIKELYTMFEASMARKIYENKKRYSRFFSTESHDDEGRLSGLLGYYDTKIARDHLKRVFRVPQAKESIATDDSLFPEKEKACELMQLLQEGTASQEMYHFILSFVKHRQNIRHLDFSNYAFTGDALRRFEFFLTELLSVNPELTCVTVHPDNAEYFRSSAVYLRINKYKQQASAYRLLTDNNEKQNPLVNQHTLDFFEKNQERTIQEYNEKTAHFLSVITPEDKKGSINDWMNPKEDVPVDEKTPWHFIVWARRELSEKCANVLNAFKKEPTPNTSETKDQQLIAVAPESSSSYASMAYSLLSSATNSIFSAVSNFVSSKEESPFSYLDEKDPKEKQLQAITEEAKRITDLWEHFEALELSEPTEERMKAQARIIASILYQGLYLPPAMHISDIDKPPEKQKANLFHPDGRCRHYPWDIYGADSDSQKALHAKTFNIIQHEAMTWLDKIKTNQLPVSFKLKKQIKDYIETQRDIAQIDIAGQRQDRAQEQNAAMLAECFRLDAIIENGKASRKAKENQSMKQSGSNDSFFNAAKIPAKHRENCHDEGRSRSFSDSQTSP